MKNKKYTYFISYCLKTVSDFELGHSVFTSRLPIDSEEGVGAVMRSLEKEHGKDAVILNFQLLKIEDEK